MPILNEREVREFARELHADTVERSGGGVAGEVAADFKVNVFTRIVLDYLTDSGIAEEGEVCYFEKRLAANRPPARTNGFYLSEEGDRLDLFYTIYTATDGTSLEKLTELEIKEALQRSTATYVYAGRGNLSQLEESSDAYSMMSQIHGAVDTIKKLRVFLVTDKTVPAKVQDAIQKQLRNLSAESTAGLVLRMELVDLTRLHRLVKRGAERDPISIDLTTFVAGGLPCLVAPVANEAYACYLAVIPGSLLFDLYEEYGSRLLQLNVRAFLQLRGNVNKGIRKTLLEEPSMFLPYNNGISATAERVELGVDDQDRTTITSIRGLQVVNGGQTMASIHRARKADHAHIDDVFVQAKISVVTNRQELEFEDLVTRISLYANSQNRVNMADFSSNDPFHVELDRLARETYLPGERSRWFYERARGSYQVMKTRFGTTPARLAEFERNIPANQVFSKTDVTKYLAAWAELPHLVGRGSQKNFVEYMAVLKSEHTKKWLPDAVFYRQMIAKAIIYRTMEKIARDEQFPGYRAQVVAQTVALVGYHYGARMNLDRVWRTQSISLELRETMRTWCHVVFDEIRESAGQRNVAEWCKREGSWEHVRSLDLEMPDDLPETLDRETAMEDDAPVESDESRAGEALATMAAAAEVMSYPAEAWRLMAEWGSGTKDLTSAQVKLCYTLAKLADGDWEKAPTPRQGKQAAILLRTVRHRTDLLSIYDD